MLLLLNLIVFKIVAVFCDLLLIEIQQVAQSTLHQLAEVGAAVILYQLHSFIEDELNLGFELQKRVLVLSLLTGHLKSLIVTHQFLYSLLFGPREREFIKIGGRCWHD